MTYKQILAVARAELGYIGKISNMSLDDKTANTRGAYTKYARDMYDAGYYNGNKQGFAWCCTFVDWLFWEAAGHDKTAATLCKPTGSLGAGVKYSKNYMASEGLLRASLKDAQPGDVIFFKRNGELTHTGIVEAVDASARAITTIEGNVNNEVVRKTYKLTDSYLDSVAGPRYKEEDIPTKIICPCCGKAIMTDGTIAEGETEYFDFTKFIFKLGR